MRYLKKSLIVFFIILVSIFLVKVYISTNNFAKNLEKILNSSGLNVEFSDIKLEKFNKLKIENFKLKDMDGNIVIDAKNTTANLNLLMPSRLLRIDVHDAIVNLERRKNNDFNTGNNFAVSIQRSYFFFFFYLTSIFRTSDGKQMSVYYENNIPQYNEVIN